MEAIKSLAAMLAALPDEAVEGILQSYDALIAVSGVEARSLAAEAVAGGQPSGGAISTAAGAFLSFPTPLPNSEDSDEDDEEDEGEISPYMEKEPPKLPDLPVCFFFPGLVVRVVRDFADAYGRAMCSTDLIRLIDCVHEHDEYALTCLDRNIRLKATQAEIIANAGNAWFQPVPTTDCLEDLLASIEQRLGKSEEDDDADLERIELLRDDIYLCAAWIAESAPRSAAPRCGNGPMAARLFGPDHEVSAWVRLLFAAVQVV